MHCGILILCPITWPLLEWNTNYRADRSSQLPQHHNYNTTLHLECLHRFAVAAWKHHLAWWRCALIVLLLLFGPSSSHIPSLQMLSPTSITKNVHHEPKGLVVLIFKRIPTQIHALVLLTNQILPLQTKWKPLPTWQFIAQYFPFPRSKLHRSAPFVKRICIYFHR